LPAAGLWRAAGRAWLRALRARALPALPGPVPGAAHAEAHHAAQRRGADAQAARPARPAPLPDRRGAGVRRPHRARALDLHRPHGAVAALGLRRRHRAPVGDRQRPLRARMGPRRDRARRRLVPQRRRVRLRRRRSQPHRGHHPARPVRRAQAPAVRGPGARRLWQRRAARRRRRGRRLAARQLGHPHHRRAGVGHPRGRRHAQDRQGRGVAPARRLPGHADRRGGRVLGADPPAEQAQIAAPLPQAQGRRAEHHVPPDQALVPGRHAALRAHLQPHAAGPRQDPTARRQVDLQHRRAPAGRQRHCRLLRQEAVVVRPGSV
ncbi:hypothetical protein GGI00_007124, partial [Coemansia sp. RSA 2681]